MNKFEQTWTIFDKLEQVWTSSDYRTRANKGRSWNYLNEQIWIKLTEAHGFNNILWKEAAVFIDAGMVGSTTCKEITTDVKVYKIKIKVTDKTFKTTIWKMGNVNPYV